MSAGPQYLLRILTGAKAGITYRVDGPSVLVGRSEECTVALPDPGLSRRHFELQLTGDSWRVRDIGSRNGITVNGQTVREAYIRVGDEIEAGGVTCRLDAVRSRLSAAAPHEEGASSSGSERAARRVGADGAVRRVGSSDPTSGSSDPTIVPGNEAIQLFPDTAPTLSPMAAPPSEGTLLSALLRRLRPDSDTRLYALVDGAQAFDLAFAGRLMGHGLYTLFSGRLAQTVAHAGPCLVVIDERSAFLARWVEKVGSHAGVLFESAAEFPMVCGHLRRLFVAQDEEGQEYFFRFYDPRVLRTFLPTCRAQELHEFFGPVERWIAESEDAASFTIFALGESGQVEAAAVTGAAQR